MNINLRKIQSFVRRDSRITAAQAEALELLWPKFGIEVGDQLVNFSYLFKREAKTIVEIGFGSGQSLLAIAKENPLENYIGVETHKPGIGALLLGVATHGLSNIRVYYGDAVGFLQQNIGDNLLAGIQIFFPDPWPKRKHHKRRLIQTEFVQVLMTKLQVGGLLHLATDWQDYAEHMMKVLSAMPGLSNVSGVNQYADRSVKRPIITKFERRGIQSGRKIWELQFEKINISEPRP